MNHAAVRKRDHLLQHMVDGLPIEHAARPSRVIGHHAADRCPAGRRNVGRKSNFKRSELRIELIKNDSGLNPHPELAFIYFEYSVVILRNIDLQAFADRLSGLRGAAAAHGDGNFVLTADLQSPKDLFSRLRDHDAQRANLINACVGRIKRPREIIEANFSDVGALEVGLKNCGGL